MKLFIRILMAGWLFLFFNQCDSFGGDPEKDEVDTFDDSGLSEILKMAYHEDAALIAITEMNRDSLLKHQVPVPEDLLIKYYRALVNIYNSADIAQTQQIQHIHNYHSDVVRQYILQLSIAAPWLSNWIAGNHYTGVAVLDSLFEIYPVEFLSVHQPGPGMDYQVIFQTEDFVNNRVYPSLFNNIDAHIHYVERNYKAGDGNRISAVCSGDSVLVTYSQGWGDCPAGCIERHYWEFAVVGNRVFFKREYGDPIL